MKNKYYQQKISAAKRYNKTKLWKCVTEGIRVIHCYEEPRDLSWWDDFGFFCGSQRVMVWWQNPRHVYMNQIEELAWAEAGESPKGDLFDDSEKVYKKVGNSRKKVKWYTMKETSGETADYYEKYRNIRDRLMNEGIDFEVSSSVKISQYDYCRGVSLICSVEIRTEEELISFAKKISAQMKNGTLNQECILKEYPGKFGKQNWLDEQKIWKEKNNA